MITCSQANLHSDEQINTKKTSSTPAWQLAMKNAIRSPEKLLEHLNLPIHLSETSIKAADHFRVFVPLSFIERMEKGNINDPLLRQVLPLSEEMINTPGFSADPLGEQSANPVRGVLHKYKGRLLVFPSTHCAINCRYCFRRHFPYDENRMNRESWQHAISYISKNSDITEVIFSGGDPLAINDYRLQWLVSQIEKITHIKRLRIHTRLPVVIPERVNDTLLKWLSGTRLKTIMVVHCNHANEINSDVSHAFSLLKNNNVTLLNQSVLLKGVNDSIGILSHLSEKLFDSGVLPYYLHLPDKVNGTAHFNVTEEKARRLTGELGKVCPGYLLPRLVREEKGKPCKIILSPIYD